MFDRLKEERAERRFQIHQMRKWLTWSIAATAAGIGAYLGAGLGVAGGAHLRATGEGFIGEAEQFWLEVFIVVSLLLAFPRATRWVSLALSGAYILSLALGYFAGYHWGNFLGWHPD